MSKITREDVLEAKRILYEYAKMSKPIAGKKGIEYCNKLITDYFNQQTTPKELEEVLEAWERVKYTDVEHSHSDVMLIEPLPSTPQLSDNVEELFEIVKDWTYQDYSNERYVAKFTVEDRLKRKEALLKLKQHIQAQASKIKRLKDEILLWKATHKNDKKQLDKANFEISALSFKLNAIEGIMKGHTPHEYKLLRINDILKGDNNEENNNNE